MGNADLFHCPAKKRQTQQDRFLAEIETVTPQLSLAKVIAPHYSGSGGHSRPPVGLERIPRMYVAQQRSGLSDEATEDVLSGLGHGKLASRRLSRASSHFVTCPHAPLRGNDKAN